MTGFFTARPVGGIGLVLFLNAGDPPLGILEPMLRALDAARVDCLELAVPFPDSVSDGPLIRRSADRALANGTDLDGVLSVVARLRPQLRHLKIALLADWRHTVRHQPLPDFLRRVSGTGADAVLVHGLPPRLGPALSEEAGRIGLPLVTSCYASSTSAVMDEAARRATAYLYLVAHYGRTGTTPPQGFAALAPVIGRLRNAGRAPVAVGFGVKERAHLDALRLAGADAAIVGSAFVALMEAAQAGGRDAVAEAVAWVEALRPSIPAVQPEPMS
ncbi:tryptophan synthase subunit alpha [Roseomonas genomospecies 6]|uniref:tryptophan synthase n=1 Tax=Roseomonas genomospecies 6 TaxID=214106 RepID=A0A9W7NJL2_9PROT|nr:tryptophan synthase subunit alpha [Roseomonas genomospecies 6]KAA0680608.1 tryptophan synthase subunit alpha [Roseomonas genomospecies 6]